MLLYQQHQLVSRRQALAHLSPSAVRYLLETGRWRLAYRGVYLAGAGPLTQDQREVMASLIAGAGHPAALGGLSALARLGLRGFPREPVHVLLPWQRRQLRPPSWVVIHRTRRLDPEDLHPTAAPPHTRAVRSLIDAAAWADDPDETVAIVTAGCAQGLVDGDQLTAALADRPKVRRRRLMLRAATEAAGSSG